jgi:hypothetical protein
MLFGKATEGFDPEPTGTHWQFASFPDYGRSKWDYTRRYADMLIAPAQVFT